MSVSINIHSSCASIDMTGRPNPATAYSLSGHVSISINPTTSLFGSFKPVDLILQSLSLTFEGQQEVVTRELGYQSIRLCEIKRELAPREPVRISNMGYEESNKASVWNFIFDIPIPGWLPSSSTFGSDQHGPAGTSYNIFATATFLNLGECRRKGGIVGALCMLPFRRRTRTLEAIPHAVQIKRFVSYLNSDGTPLRSLPPITFGVQGVRDENGACEDSPRLPFDVVSKVQILASIPRLITMQDPHVPLILRLRATGFTREQQRRLRLTGFKIEVLQIEKFRTDPTPSYKAQFPLPPDSQQPDKKPLLSTHPMKYITDVGLLAAGGPHDTSLDLFSLLPPTHTGRYHLEGNGLSLLDEAAEEGEAVWFKMEVNVPMLKVNVGEDEDWERRHGKVKQLRPDEDTPLFSVRHDMFVKASFAYDPEEEGGEVVKDELSFTVPFEIASVPHVLVARPGSEAPDTDSPVLPMFNHPYRTATSPVSARASPDLRGTLPPYSQLYHPNGERKVDYSVPLPAYTPSGSSLDEKFDDMGRDLFYRPSRETLVSSNSSTSLISI